MTLTLEPTTSRRRSRQYRHTHANFANACVVLTIAVAGAVLVWAEGYAPLLRWPFGVYSGLVLATVIWVAFFDITTKRLVALVLVSGALGLLTQWVGASENRFWSYARPSHWLVAPMFMCAATMAYGLTVAVLVPLLRRVGLARKLRPLPALVLLVAPLGVLVLDAPGPQLTSPTSFWIYYGLLALVAWSVAVLVDVASWVALACAAVIAGAASETLGAASGLWSFSHQRFWPPAFLLFGSWPLEIVTHWGLSALLARESPLPRRRYFVEPTSYRPLPDHPMWSGGAEQEVRIVEGDDKLSLLARLLDETELERQLERRAQELGTTRQALKIAIKPNFMFMYSDRDRSTFTDPELVEHLADWLRDRGFETLAVVEAQSAYGNYFLDRNVENVARVCGYRPRGRYRIVDLTLEKVAYEFAGPLGKHSVGVTWRDADFRISFAKNKTHTWAWYTLTLKNIYGALPEQDKILEYHHLREIYSPAIDLLVAFPVHFGLIDAFESADGPFGIFADREPNPTHTLIAGTNLVAVDWVGAQKMGLDPMVSRYMQLAVQVFGTPRVEVIGNTAPYSPWCNVPKEIADFWDTAEEHYGFTNTMFHALNRNYMSPEFRRRPATRLLSLLLPLIAPLGGLVYKDPPHEDKSARDTQ